MGVSVLVALTACEPNLNGDKQKASYAIGQQIGGQVAPNLKAQDVNADPDALAAGFRDAIAGKPPRLKPEDMQKALKALQEESMKRMQASAEKNKAEADAWLAQHAKEAGWKTTPSGLQYKVVTEGEGAHPKATDTVVVHYTGTLTNGEKFDSSVDRGQPAEFQLDHVIPGWTEGVQLMKKGGRFEFAIPPNLAYGPRSQPKIPGNSVLLFDVQLLDIKPGAKKK